MLPFLDRFRYSCFFSVHRFKYLCCNVSILYRFHSFLKSHGFANWNYIGRPESNRHLYPTSLASQSGRVFTTLPFVMTTVFCSGAVKSWLLHRPHIDFSTQFRLRRGTSPQSRRSRCCSGSENLFRIEAWRMDEPSTLSASGTIYPGTPFRIHIHYTPSEPECHHFTAGKIALSLCLWFVCRTGSL